MSTPMSYEDISDLDGVLCSHCVCTEFGLSMGAQNATAYSFGCEGSYCAEAYQQYLEDFEEE